MGLQRLELLEEELESTSCVYGEDVFVLEVTELNSNNDSVIRKISDRPTVNLLFV